MSWSRSEAKDTGQFLQLAGRSEGVGASAQPLRILIGAFGFPPQEHGISVVAWEHARRLLLRGHDVTVVTSPDARRPGFEYPPGMKVVEFAATGSGYLRSPYRGDIDAYRRFIAAFDGDIICLHCWQVWITDAAVSAFTSTPARKVLISHGSSVNHLGPGWRGLARWALWRPYAWGSMPRIMRAFDRVVTLSGQDGRDRFYDRRLATRLGLDRRFVVIPNGGMRDEIDRAAPTFRAEYNIRAGFMALSVASYDPRKNQLRALQAFIDARIPGSAMVFIGNALNDYTAAMLDLWERSKAPDDDREVHVLTGIPREAIFRAFRSADAYVVTSTWEAQPLSVLDAMAAGVPFVSTDVGCVTELPGGVVIHDDAQLREALVRLAQDESARRELGRLGRAAVEQTYNWDRVIDQYEELFRGLVAADLSAAPVGAR